MKLTSRGELALKAMIELAALEAASDREVPSPEIAFRCGASLRFLEQVLGSLRDAGLVVSSRGRAGGFRLARSAGEIYAGEISRAIDGPLAPAPCASVTRHRTCDWCRDEELCTLKPLWIQVRDAIAGVMDSVSLADLATRMLPADRYRI